MRRNYLISAGLFLLVAIFIAYGAVRLKYYTQLGPGPGFFSLWLSFFLAIASLAMGIEAWGKPPEKEIDTFLPQREGLIKIGSVLLSLIFTIVMLEPLGFRLTMVTIYIFLLWILGQRGISTLLIALAGSFGVYQIFVDLLSVPLPIGFLGI
jgi:putative tricarboxylic transport membrane protein